MSTLIIALWIVGLGAKVIAAWQIVRKGLFHRLPIFWAFIVISIARSVVLLCVIPNPRQYADIAADSLPMMLLTEAFAISSVFWAVTENFPRWRRTGTISLTALGLIGTAAAMLIRSAAVPKDWGYGWPQAWEWALLLQRNVMVAMGVVLLGIRFLLALVRVVPVHPVARRAADVLCIDVALSALNATLTMWVGRQYPIVAYMGPVLAGIANGALWAFWLPAAAVGREVAYDSWRRHEVEIDWRECFADLIGRIRLQFTERS